MLPKTKVWRVKKYVPVVSSCFHPPSREGPSSLVSDTNFGWEGLNPLDLAIKFATISTIPCNISDSFDLEPSVLIKSLSVAALMDVEEGIYRSLNLETGVDLLDKFIPGDSSLRDLGFISPINPLKGSGSGYFL